MTAGIIKHLREDQGLRYSIAKLEELGKAAAAIGNYSFQHLLFIGGWAGVAYGLWMWWHPAGFMAGGWFAVRISMLMAKK